MIPTLETPRLRLRAHGLADVPASAAMWAEPAVYRFISGKPSTEQQVWARVLGYAGHWALQGFGYWLVEEKATGAFVGEIGLADFKRDLEPSIRGLPEAGWVLAPAAHGKGYATEALGAVLAWADESARFARVVCIVAPENEASLRVAAKCGFREVARTTYLGEPTVLMERAR